MVACNPADATHPQHEFLRRGPATREAPAGWRKRHKSIVSPPLGGVAWVKAKAGVPSACGLAGGLGRAAPRFRPVCRVGFNVKF